MSHTEYKSGEKRTTIQFRRLHHRGFEQFTLAITMQIEIVTEQALRHRGTKDIL